MREIKVRAWDALNKKMTPAIDISQSREYWEWDWLGVFDFPIMQFTGLKDKNGKEIFEGDIVAECSVGKEIWDGKGRVTISPKGVVEYEYAGFNVRQITIGEVDFGDGTGSELHISKYDGEFLWNGTDDIEVIGNIYQNPELLEKP